MPRLVARCRYPDPKANRGLARGKFIGGYIYFGGIVDSNVNYRLMSTVHVQFRLDDGKLQDHYWPASKDFSAVFFSEIHFNTLLYGHFMPHKENTSPQVRKVVVGIPEFLGGEAVVQFDMPDANEVADTCGVIVHKHRI